MAIEILEFPTCFRINNTKENIKAMIDIMDDLTFIDYDGVPNPVGYSYDPNKGTLKIPKGYTLQRIQSKIKTKYTYEKIDALEVEHNDLGWDVHRTPYDYQMEIINETLRHFDKGHNQFIIDLVGGKGKTLTALFIASKLNVPILIICKSNELIKQWYSGLLEKTSLKIDDIYRLEGAGAINYIESMTYKHPVYISTHATIRNIISKFGYIVLNKALNRMGVGLKIIDEFDQEFKNIMDIDLNTPIMHNIYLTATTYKNSKNEDKVFQHAFKSIKRKGGEMFLDEIPKRDMKYVYIKTYPDPLDRKVVYNYNANEFNNYRYNTYLADKKRPYLIAMLRPFIEEFRDKSDKEDICVVYCEKKETCGIVAKILSTQFGIETKDIGIVNSDIDEYQKKENMKKKYICSTAKSLGRGIDLSLLTLGINLEVYAGESIFEQQVFRLGRTGGKHGTFVTFSDVSFSIIESWNTVKLEPGAALFDKVDLLYLDVTTGKFINRRDDL